MYDIDWFILDGLIIETNFLVFGVKLESFYSYVGNKVKSNNVFCMSRVSTLEVNIINREINAFLASYRLLKTLLFG
ncbi:hypothetical protein A1Q5_11280 [Aliivibrio logei 5S-186]|uniref:Uncharacterized protein n=1 Tax=Aliivibrio logei 5S-186 TaxID=626086 RepID=A0ABX3AT46_ALILO|nr:hypothetical protein A1Q5_11280 [Aliivibrio logei 5S-186]